LAGCELEIPLTLHLITGGQKSGKSRHAEHLTQQWLASSSAHHAVMIATATAHDDEMQQRIQRHQAHRQLQLSRMQLVEEPLHVAQQLADWSRPDTLVMIDCMTLWLTNWMMPARTDEQVPSVAELEQGIASLLSQLQKAAGPVLVVSNEIGWGVIPLGSEVRSFVDRLGALNQALAQQASQVTLMVAGLPLPLKS
jgi:adenosylcobinamide kinase/adenosylcobinamide-phosphate guanylyltransferase